MEQLKRLSEFMEKHLVLFMLSKPSHLQYKIEVLSRTKMADALSDAFTELNGCAPQANQFSILEHKDKILSELEELDQKVKPLLNSKEDLLDSEISILKTYSKLQYEIGDYSCCANILEELRRADERDHWGELMVDILLDRKQAAHNLIENIQESVQSIKDKSWLLHATLFVSFPDSPGFFYDRISMNKFINTIEIGCPHLIRYAVASILLYKPSKLAEFAKHYLHIIRSESSLEFLVEIFTNFNFQKAFELLNKFREEMQNDYFLESKADKILLEAKNFIAYCYLKVNLKVEAQWIKENAHEDPKRILDDIQDQYMIRINFDGKFYQKVQHKSLKTERIQTINEMIDQCQKLLSK